MVEIDKLTKLYYSIGEVADMFEVNTSLIRFWEKEFPSIQPKKNKKGNRLFSPKSIGVIQKIYHLVKVEGHTLEGARKALKSKTNPSSSSSSAHKELIARLEEIKRKIQALN